MKAPDMVAPYILLMAVQDRLMDLQALKDKCHFRSAMEAIDEAMLPWADLSLELGQKVRFDCDRLERNEMLIEPGDTSHLDAGVKPSAELYWLNEDTLNFPEYF